VELNNSFDGAYYTPNQRANSKKGDPHPWLGFSSSNTSNHPHPHCGIPSLYYWKQVHDRLQQEAPKHIKQLMKQALFGNLAIYTT
jgi:hypothetical protein